ncbi:sodium:proton antiporter [Stieleria sp. ICT_E10.1]|uniref:cation:proton antiporter n=1 Tax=Stieleria sedimenti TaxID=2976331 RepID=UPI00217F92AC|nr:sodium:proton antiporter [Stieleria sedimenti]MCS7467261.1 sodium:proton antiporter [Stieleria sedimenti]
MELFTITSAVIALSALFGYVNVKLLKLPNTIGLMVIAIVFTLVLFASSMFTDVFLASAERLIGAIDFESVLLDVMLGFLLFAGAMHTNFDQLRVQRWPVLVFSTLGVLASTFLVAVSVHFVFGRMGLEVPLIHCLLFGALISPTDPIAVLGILKKAGVPKALETKIVGESLFNDGVGVVVFLTIMSIASGGMTDHGGGHEAANENVVAVADAAEASVGTHDHGGEGGTTVGSVVQLFAQEVLGGILLGLALGYVVFLLLRSIDDYEIEVMITLACVMGGYSLAHALHLSAPLAIVVAGLIVGNDTVRGTMMSKQTEQYVDKFWELMDMLMNAILFVLIGLELLILEVRPEYILASLAAIVIVLVSRYLSLIPPVWFFAKRLKFAPHTSTIMAWGGLRGGISIALALSLPVEMNRGLLVTVTYAVVVFSIIVQGLTVGMLANKLIGRESEESAKASV